MSLVNKMLRDLDARRVGDDERAALPPAVTPLAAMQESRGLPPWMLLGAGAAILAAALAAWNGYRDSIPAPTVAALPPAPAPAPDSPPAPPTPSGSPSLRMAEALSSPPMPIARSAPAENSAAAIPKPVERRPAEVPVPPPAPVVAAKPAPAVETRIDKQPRLPSAAERAEAEYRRGVLALRQGDADGAAASYRAALDDYPEHGPARQSLATLLIDARRFDDAEELLRKGTELAPVRLASTLAWARLKVERNQAAAALELLQKNAAVGERSAEYQGFTAALLNRAGRTGEAVEHYQAATRLAPAEGRWWAGLGIALDAGGKAPEAREAYLKARSLPGLPADLAQHIEQRLR